MAASRELSQERGGWQAAASGRDAIGSLNLKP
jgi:hypothetical protein